MKLQLNRKSGEFAIGLQAFEKTGAPRYKRIANASDRQRHGGDSFISSREFSRPNSFRPPGKTPSCFARFPAKRGHDAWGVVPVSRRTTPPECGLPQTGYSQKCASQFPLHPGLRTYDSGAIPGLPPDGHIPAGTCGSECRYWHSHPWWLVTPGRCWWKSSKKGELRMAAKKKKAAKKKAAPKKAAKKKAAPKKKAAKKKKK